MLPQNCLHSLTIDFESAARPVRAAFDFTSEEWRALYGHAGQEGVPLLILRGDEWLRLMSTSHHQVRAFRPLLAQLRQRLEEAAGWRKLNVRITSGSDAARDLLRHAIPSPARALGTRRFLLELRAAAELSRSCRAFSPELAAAIRMTEQAAERVWQETRLGRPRPNESDAAELELETLLAERIVEEELVAWQCSYPALRASRRPFSDADIGHYDSEPRHSMIRLRTAAEASEFRRFGS